MDAVDVLSRLPKNFNEQVESTKWAERKEALESLLKLCSDNPVLDPSGNYGEIVSILKKIVSKDSNINVVSVAAKCIAAVASGLRKKFSSFAIMLAPVILEKFKEKKLLVANACNEAMDAIFRTTTLEQLCEALVAALDSKTPSVRIQTAFFVSRSIAASNPNQLSKKLLKDLCAILVKNVASSADLEVRDSSANAIGAAMKIAGDKNVLPFLNEIKDDHMKMEKIREYCEKTVPIVSSSENSTTGKGQNGLDNVDGGDGGGPSEAVEQEFVVVDTWETLDPVDVLSKLPKNFYEQLESAKWQERKESLEAFLKLCADYPRLDPSSSYGEIVSVLKKIIGKDSNINVVGPAAKSIAALATGLRKKFTPFASMLAPVILEKFKEKKPVVANACVEAIDAIFKTTTLEAISEEIVSALDNKTPSVKIQTSLFVSRAIASSPPSQITKKLLKDLCAALVKNMSSSDAEVRESSACALGAAFKVAGEKNVMPFLNEIKDENLKMAKIREHCEKTVIDPAIAARSNDNAPKAEAAKSTVVTKAPAAAPPKTKPPPSSNRPQASSADSSASSVSENAKSSASQPENDSAAATKKPPSSARAQSAARKPGETSKAKKEQDSTAEGSLLIDTNQKAQRFQEEKALKILKWNFTTPTEEHVEQLQNQLGTVCKPSLFALLFTTNFKQHLKALEILISCIETSPEATVNASDLFLKWTTLRFFETNPSVLTKTLEYLQLLLQLMVDQQIELHDYEVTSFLPYLLLKAGDQKEAVRQEVRKLIQKLTLLHSATKIFPIILEASKSTKNSRQKAECLEQLGSLINLLGVTVCGTPPQASLRSIAQNIGDKDNSVRNAALNAIVAAYNHMGDKVHKIIGAINEKDFAMLQERIKRSSKSKTSANPTPSISAATAAVVAGRPRTTPAHNQQQQRSASTNRRSPPSATSSSAATTGRTSSPSTAPVSSRASTEVLEREDEVKPNKLDLSYDNGNGEDYEKGLYRLELSKIFDKSQLRAKLAPIPQPSIRPEVTRILENPFEMPKIMQQPRPSPSMHRSPSSSSSNGLIQNDILAVLDGTISQVTSSSISTAVQSLVQIHRVPNYLTLDEILKDGSKNYYLTGKIDQLLMAVYFQLRMACSTHMKDVNIDQNDVLRLYRHLVVVLLSLCSAGDLIKEASDGALKDLVCQLLTVLLDERLKSTNEGSDMIRSINMLIVNLVTKSEHTSCIVALLQLLRDTLHSQTSSAQFSDLVMKVREDECYLLAELKQTTRMCIWKISRQLPTFADQMRLDRVILECHNFFVDFPTLSWKSRSNNMPLRTVKTILNSLCNIFGDKILDHVNLVERAENSEAVLYMKKCLGDIYGSQPNGAMPSSGDSKDQQAQKNLENKKEISRILKRTGHKETTKQGLSELYDFIQQNPDFDMEQYYRKLTPEFREYIAKGLKKLSSEKTKAEKPNSNSPGFAISSEYGISAMEALQRLRQKGGLAPSSKICVPTVNNNNLLGENREIQQQSVISNNIDKKNEQPAAGDFRRTTSDDENIVAESQVDLLIVQEENDNAIDELKLRLEKIKRGGAF